MKLKFFLIISLVVIESKIIDFSALEDDLEIKQVAKVIDDVLKYFPKNLQIINQGFNDITTQFSQANGKTYIQKMIKHKNEKTTNFNSEANVILIESEYQV
ncbi:hypothetical protein PVAND_005834 [Polypedilum vanderplanki]|uniref:Uncharacterized protein n=1 Tax=Polypedilum vanderplanki TaxID=319348 RepID=A0A9J6C1T7_POLVA|nr:hypothetical protein PVAND_005834 [Polypedilum vanderplanki]